MSIRFRDELRIIPGLLALLFLPAAFGPWGVSEVTGWSQAGRLEALLTQKGILTDGKWKADSGSSQWSLAEARQIPSALSELALTEQLIRLRPWFQDLPDDPFASAGNPLPRLQARLGVRASSTAPIQPAINFYSRSPPVLTMPSGGYVIGPIHHWELQSSGSKTVPAPFGPLKVASTGATVEISIGNDKKAKFDLAGFLTGVRQALAAQAQHASTLKEDVARIISGEGDLDVKIAIVTAGGDLDAKSRYSWTVYVLLPQSP